MHYLLSSASSAVFERIFCVTSGDPDKGFKLFKAVCYIQIFGSNEGYVSFYRLDTEKSDNWVKFVDGFRVYRAVGFMIGQDVVDFFIREVALTRYADFPNESFKL